MSFCSTVLLMVALVCLTTQCAYASYIDGGYDDNKHNFGFQSACIPEGGDCVKPLSICCSGMRCRRQLWPIAAHCENKHSFYEKLILDQ